MALKRNAVKTKPKPKAPDKTKLKLTGDWSVDRALLLDARDAALADYTETRNAIIRSELVSREVINHIYGNIFSIIRSQIHTLGETNSTIIASVLGLKSGGKEIIHINNILTNAAYALCSEIKKAMQDYLEDHKNRCGKE